MNKSDPLDIWHRFLAATVRMLCPWVRAFEQPAVEAPEWSEAMLERVRRERVWRATFAAGNGNLRDHLGLSAFVPGDPLPCPDICDEHEIACELPEGHEGQHMHYRVCSYCGSPDNLLDTKDRCWDCNDEIRRAEREHHRESD